MRGTPQRDGHPAPKTRRQYASWSSWGESAPQRRASPQPPGRRQARGKQMQARQPVPPCPHRMPYSSSQTCQCQQRPSPSRPRRTWRQPQGTPRPHPTSSQEPPTTTTQDRLPSRQVQHMQPGARDTHRRPLQRQRTRRTAPPETRQVAARKAPEKARHSQKVTARQVPAECPKSGKSPEAVGLPSNRRRDPPAGNPPCVTTTPVRRVRESRGSRRRRTACEGRRAGSRPRCPPWGRPAGSCA